MLCLTENGLSALPLFISFLALLWQYAGLRTSASLKAAAVLILACGVEGGDDQPRMKDPLPGGG